MELLDRLDLVPVLETLLQCGFRRQRLGVEGAGPLDGDEIIGCGGAVRGAVDDADALVVAYSSVGGVHVEDLLDAALAQGCGPAVGGLVGEGAIVEQFGHGVAVADEGVQDGEARLDHDCSRGAQGKSPGEFGQHVRGHTDGGHADEGEELVAEALGGLVVVGLGAVAPARIRIDLRAFVLHALTEVRLGGLVVTGLFGCLG